MWYWSKLIIKILALAQFPRKRSLRQSLHAKSLLLEGAEFQESVSEDKKGREEAKQIQGSSLPNRPEANTAGRSGNGGGMRLTKQDLTC